MHSHSRGRTVWAKVLSNSCFGCRQSRNSYTLIEGSQEDILLDQKVRLIDSTTTSYRSFPPSNPPSLTASPPVAALSSSRILARPSSVNSISYRDILDCASCQRKSLRSSDYLGYDHKCQKHMSSTQDPALFGLSNVTPNPPPIPQLTPPSPLSPSPPSPPPRRLQRRAVLSPTNYHADELPPSRHRTPKPERANGSTRGFEPVNELSIGDGINLLGAGTGLVGAAYSAATYYKGRNANRTPEAQQADLEMGLADITTREAAVASESGGVVIAGAALGSGSGAGQAAPSTGIGAGRDIPMREQDFIWTGMK